jgi:heterotetrameric sarcosine oxidase gamma subunit
VSAPEPAASAVRVARVQLNVREWIAFDEPALRHHASAAGIELAAPQGLHLAAERLTLSVRPGRWLLVDAGGTAGAAGSAVPAPPSAAGACVELSSALAALLLAGSGAREVLARGCRLDLDARVFPAGRAAATLMAQVAVTLAVLPRGFLLLTPASTARYFEEWLTATARPFGVRAPGTLTFQELSGDRPL